jgi:predicted lysophospholipase L1 biosynthesis ABC-type transport system permease subunit
MAKPASIQRWERTRAEGLARYILVHGIVLYGLPMFVLMTFVVHRQRLSLAFVLASGLLWAIGGALFGWMVWHVRERMYRRLANLFGAQGPD